MLQEDIKKEVQGSKEPEREGRGEMKRWAEGMVLQNNSSQQLLIREIHIEGSSGAEIYQNAVYRLSVIYKDYPAFHC